jgi:hypothetical protein
MCNIIKLKSINCNIWHEDNFLFLLSIHIRKLLTKIIFNVKIMIKYSVHIIYRNVQQSSPTKS